MKQIDISTPTHPNARNRRTPSTNKSGFKGVHWRKSANKWRATITVDSRRLELGCYFCVIKAAKAYDTAARKYYGEFASTNFKAVAFLESK